MNSSCHLYLVCRLCVIVAVLAAFIGDALGQSRKKPRGPRALAVLEMGPPAEAAAASPGAREPLAKGVGFPRLFPVTILENGKYYDATVYKATPVPLAVQQGVVYDVQHNGVPQGLFTIQRPSQFHGTWVAMGDWLPGVTEGPITEKPIPSGKLVDDDPPPRLTRKPVAKTSAAAKRAAPPKATAASWMAAISDADPYDRRPYEYPWTPEWKRRYSDEMLALAQRELANYRRCPKCDAKLENVEIRAFDLDTDNDAELVLTARARRASSPQVIYLAVVGRVGWQARVEKVFAWLTDDAHLDTDGRLQFIDAVDSDGDGRGEILFRRVHHRTQSFELYRVGRDRLTELFSGAESNL
jgi:hypothetical protein